MATSPTAIVNNEHASGSRDVRIIGTPVRSFGSLEARLSHRHVRAPSVGPRRTVAGNYARGGSPYPSLRRSAAGTPATRSEMPPPDWDREWHDRDCDPAPLPSTPPGGSSPRARRGARVRGRD